MIAGAVCFVVCLIVNLSHLRNLKSGKNKLRLWCGVVASGLLICILGGNILLNSFLIQNRHLYAECKEFKSLKSFRNHMGKEVAPDGSIRVDFETISGGYRFFVYDGAHNLIDEYVLTEGDIYKQLIEMDAPSSHSWVDRFAAEYGYEFEHSNRSMVHWEVSDTEDLVPIYTFDTYQLEAANQIALGWNFQYALLYLFPITITGVIYLILRRKFT